MEDFFMGPTYIYKGKVLPPIERTNLIKSQLNGKKKRKKKNKKGEQLEDYCGHILIGLKKYLY